MINQKTENVLKNLLACLFLLLSSIHVFLIFGIRAHNCPSEMMGQTGSCSWMLVGKLELVFWLLGMILIFIDLIRDKKINKYFKACISIWPVFIFLLLALMSVSWSILKWITLYKVFILFSTSLAGIYLGFTFGAKKIQSLISCFFLFVFGSSLFYIFMTPFPGIMFDSPYLAWRGIFWTKNYFSCFLSFAMFLVFVRMITVRKFFTLQNIGNAFCFVIYGYLIYKSNSATGLVSAFFLIAVSSLIHVWIRFQHLFKRKHYIILGVSGFVLVILILINLDYLFGILGREPSMTGRVPMWKYLFENIVSQRPILGYGYGAIWHLEGLRTGLSEILGWESGAPVLIGDNGFVDIFLHLGVLGVLVIVGLLITGIIISIRYLIKEKTMESAFPLILLGFILVTNISLSMILESESVVWMITLASMVIIRKSERL